MPHEYPGRRRRLVIYFITTKTAVPYTVVRRDTVVGTRFSVAGSIIERARAPATAQPEPQAHTRKKGPAPASSTCVVHIERR